MAFVPGADLAASFYEDVVGPRLTGIVHSAALIGPGSDVLGYDDVRSTDHYWGPRMQVFVDAGDVAAARAALRDLPAEHRGWPTSFGSDKIPVRQHVDVWTAEDWVLDRLGVDPLRGLSSLDWLAIPQQLLLEATAGRVFCDDLGRLSPLRQALAWYPDDVWHWLLAAQWARIGEEEAFVGRAAEAGDELGSRVVAGRVARDVMRLCFLLERRYAPYSKWLGVAFSRLDAGPELGPRLSAALAAVDHPHREEALVVAYEALARRQNALGIHEPQDPAVRRFHDRPFRVIGGERFAAACLRAVGDEGLLRLPLVGSVDQWVDSTEVLGRPERARSLQAWYRN